MAMMGALAVPDAAALLSVRGTAAGHCRFPSGSWALREKTGLAAPLSLTFPCRAGLSVGTGFRRPAHSDAAWAAHLPPTCPPVYGPLRLRGGGRDGDGDLSLSLPFCLLPRALSCKVRQGGQPHALHTGAEDGTLGVLTKGCMHACSRVRNRNRPSSPLDCSVVRSSRRGRLPAGLPAHQVSLSLSVYMYICICMYMLCTRTRTHTHTHTHVYTYLHTFLCVQRETDSWSGGHGG